MSSEAQDAQERVHRAVRGFVGDIDRHFLRPMELETHLAAADCCRDTESSTEKVHACIEKSQSQALRAQQYMQAEMQRFQVGNEIRVTCTVVKRYQINVVQSASIARSHGLLESCCGSSPGWCTV